MIITVANFKGGCAKSTTCVSLAHGLALKGKSCLLVDCDPQGQLAVMLGQRQESCVFDLLVTQQKPDQLVRSTGRDDLWLIPGDARTATAQFVFTAERHPISYLRDQLKPVLKTFDFCVIDTSPSVGDLQGAALFAGDLVLIPTAVDFLSTEGTLKMIQTLQEIKHGLRWPGEIAGILPTFVDETTTETKTVLTELRDKFTEGVLPGIHRSTRLRECAAFGKTIFEFDRTSRPAEEYGVLVDQILKISTKGR